MECIYHGLCRSLCGGRAVHAKLPAVKFHCLISTVLSPLWHSFSCQLSDGALFVVDSIFLVNIPPGFARFIFYSGIFITDVGLNLL